MNNSLFHIILARAAAANGAFGADQVAEFKIDANETVNFLEALKAVDTTVYEDKFPGMIAKDLVAADPKCTDDGSETFEFHTYTITGMAELIANYSDDLPAVSMYGTATTAKLASYGSSYMYTIQDLKRAARGVSLSSEGPRAARKVVELKLDSVIALGDTKAGTTGLVNNANMATTSPDTGSWTSATSIDNILADIEKLVTAFVTAAKGVHTPNKLLVPYSVHRLLLKRRGTSADDTGVKAFADQFPGIEMVPWTRLETAGSGSTKRMIVGEFNSLNQARLSPREFTMEPPQAKNLAFVVPCHARCGGVIVRYPLSMRAMDGI